jgi:hypothetical protein
MKDCSVHLIERKKKRKKERKKERKKQVFGLEKIDSKKPNTILCGSHRPTLCRQGEPNRLTSK